MDYSNFVRIPYKKFSETTLGRKNKIQLVGTDPFDTS